MSYEEEAMVLIAQMALFQKRIYELRGRALIEARLPGPLQSHYRQASGELISVLCGLAAIQVRMNAAQFYFASAKAASKDL